MTTLLTVHGGDTGKVATYMEECRRLNIPILPPDVNHSRVDFAIQPLEDGVRGIRFGLAAVKNAGVNALEPIIAARLEEGPFADLNDFCKRVDLRLVGKRTLESLIKVGAMRDFGIRAQLLAALDRILSYSASYHRDQAIGQLNMFGDDSGMSEDLLSNLAYLPEENERKLLVWEKELLGLYVTGRPADKYREVLRAANTANIRELKEGEIGGHDRPVAVAGEVVSMRKILTRNNDMMCVLTLEDWRESAGTIEVVIFPRTWRQCQDLVQEGEIVRIQGKYDLSRGDPQVIAETVSQNFTVQQADTNGNGSYYDDAPPPAWSAEPDFGPEDDFVDDFAPPPEDFEPPVDEATASDEETMSSPADEVDLSTADDLLEPVPLAAQAPHSNGETSQRIVVFLQRSGDDERDQRRLQRVYNALINYPGDDRFSIITESAGKSVQLDFQTTTDVCEDLIDNLEHIVGEQNIQIHSQHN